MECCPLLYYPYILIQSTLHSLLGSKTYIAICEPLLLYITPLISDLHNLILYDPSFAHFISNISVWCNQSAFVADIPILKEILVYFIILKGAKSF
jgi:hypothetical protein